MQSHVNVGTGTDQSIAELAGLIGRIVGFEGSIRYNSSYPDGTPQKLLDVSLLKSLGWQAKIGLDEGVVSAYDWYLNNAA
jgi:nucleoside-diphosphate-sugar epimerase